MWHCFIWREMTHEILSGCCGQSKGCLTKNHFLSKVSEVYNSKVIYNLWGYISEWEVFSPVTSDHMIVKVANACDCWRCWEAQAMKPWSDPTRRNINCMTTGDHDICRWCFGISQWWIHHHHHHHHQQQQQQQHHHFKYLVVLPSQLPQVGATMAEDDDVVAERGVAWLVPSSDRRVGVSFLSSRGFQLQSLLFKCPGTSCK